MRGEMGVGGGAEGSEGVEVRGFGGGFSVSVSVSEEELASSSQESEMGAGVLEVLDLDVVVDVDLDLDVEEGSMDRFCRVVVNSRRGGVSLDVLGWREGREVGGGIPSDSVVIFVLDCCVLSLD